MVETASVFVSNKVHVDAVKSRAQSMSQVLVALAIIDCTIVVVESAVNSICGRIETDLIGYIVWIA